jgi:hypothetical protein
LLNEISNQKFNQLKPLPVPLQITNGSSSEISTPTTSVYLSQPQQPQYNSTFDHSVLSQQNMAKNLIRKQFDQLNSNLGLLKNYK